jgi:hypothetical protein
MSILKAPDFHERVLLLGDSGTGKTELLRQFLYYTNAERWLVLDNKRSFEPIGKANRDYVIVQTPTGWLWNYPHIVFRPRREFNTGQWGSYILEREYEKQVQTPKHKRQGKLIVIDEALWLAKAGAADTLGRVQVTVRELQIGMWLCSQRTRWIPLEVKANATYIIVFPLGEEEDEKDVVRMTKGRLTVADLRDLEPYGFWLIRKLPGGKLTTEKFGPVALDLSENS